MTSETIGFRLCTELQKAVRNETNFLSSVITGDESWLYNYDPETKQQYSQWKTPSSPRPKKNAPRLQQHHVNADLFFFFFFFTSEELCILCFFHLVGLLMGIFIAWFLDA